MHGSINKSTSSLQINTNLAHIKPCYAKSGTCKLKTKIGCFSILKLT